jgi:hypothetical protein
MAEFSNAVMTNEGAALLAQCEGGLAKMEFTKLVTGAGQYSDAERQRAQLQERTALKDEKQAFDFSKIAMATKTSVLLKALITNAELQVGYYVREVGIYARNALDETSTPILYSIAIANVADYLPPFNGLTPSTITQEYYATVSNSADVTITTGGGAVALAEDLENISVIVDELVVTVSDIGDNMAWMIQNVLGLQMWAELHQRATVDHMSDNTAVEIFGDTSGYIIASGSFDEENHRVIA